MHSNMNNTKLDLKYIYLNAFVAQSFDFNFRSGLFLPLHAECRKSVGQPKPREREQASRLAEWQVESAKAASRAGRQRGTQST